MAAEHLTVYLPGNWSVAIRVYAGDYPDRWQQRVLAKLEGDGWLEPSPRPHPYARMANVSIPRYLERIRQERY